MGRPPSSDRCSTVAILPRRRDSTIARTMYDALASTRCLTSVSAKPSSLAAGPASGYGSVGRRCGVDIPVEDGDLPDPSSIYYGSSSSRPPRVPSTQRADRLDAGGGGMTVRIKSASPPRARDGVRWHEGSNGPEGPYQTATGCNRCPLVGALSDALRFGTTLDPRTFLHLGCHHNGSRIGIHIFDAESAPLTAVGALYDIDNPSFIAAHPSGALLMP